MKLNVVNEQEKDIVYSILDITPELNLPCISEDERILLGNNLNALMPYSREEMSGRCHENGFVYSLFIRELELEDTISFERKGELIDFYQDYALSTLLDYFRTFNLFKAASSLTDDEKWYDIDLPEGLIENGMKLLDEDGLWNYYTKREAYSLTIAKIPPMNLQIYELTSFIFDTFIQRDDVEFPDMIAASSLQDFLVPRIARITNDFVFPELDFNTVFKDPKLLVENAVSWDNRLSGMEAANTWMKSLLPYRSVANIKFRTWNAFYSMYDYMDDATINYSDVDLKNNEGSGIVEQGLSGIYPHIYTLRLMKPGYDTVRLKMKTEINEPNKVKPFDIGTINLTKTVPRPLQLWFEWGDYPNQDDIDIHVFSFGDKRDETFEHCFFMDMHTRSVKLDRDDIDWLGPEVMTLYDYELWYLVSLHNYAYSVSNDPNDSHMNLDGRTRIKTYFYGNEISMSPPDSDMYWWDACLIHEDYLYILNEFPTNRPVHYGAEFTPTMIHELKEKAATMPSMKIHRISDYRPKSIFRTED